MGFPLVWWSGGKCFNTRGFSGTILRVSVSPTAALVEKIPFQGAAKDLSRTVRNHTWKLEHGRSPCAVVGHILAASVSGHVEMLLRDQCVETRSLVSMKPTHVLLRRAIT